MRRSLLQGLAVTLALNPLSAAQTGSLTDLRADEHRLRNQELQLDRDGDRLTLDRRAHAPRAQIRFDQAQIRRDRLEIRQLKSDIRRDRQARRRNRGVY
jgi:hypothetical protein